MIDTIEGWFEITQYDNKRAMTIMKLVETMWIIRYPWTDKITYDQGSTFFGREFQNSLFQKENIIKYKSNSSVNLTSNVILEIIHSYVSNIVSTYNVQETYVDEDYP